MSQRPSPSALPLAVAGALMAWSFLATTFIIYSYRSLAEAQPAQADAEPIRLIGLCHSQLLGGIEEDSFPAGCDWIEPVRFGNKEGR